MKRSYSFAPVLVAAMASSLLAAPSKEPPPISLGADGKLTYATDSQGNRIPDFSHCGYAGGDRPIPNAPVRVVVRRPGRQHRAHPEGD